MANYRLVGGPCDGEYLITNEDPRRVRITFYQSHVSKFDKITKYEMIIGKNPGVAVYGPGQSIETLNYLFTEE